MQDLFDDMEAYEYIYVLDSLGYDTSYKDDIELREMMEYAVADHDLEHEDVHLLVVQCREEYDRVFHDEHISELFTDDEMDEIVDTSAQDISDILEAEEEADEEPTR